MLRFCGCEFSAAGVNKKAAVYGLILNGAEDVLIEDCKFNGTGYSSLLNRTAGSVTVKNCEFECGNTYNPIEGGQSADQGALTVENCEFNGVPGNNFINFYSVADNSVHTIKDCRFHGGASNNIIRLSNITNHSATFNIENVEYEFVTGTPNEYSGMILCQDYTSRNGKPQNFSLYQVNLKNIKGPKDIQNLYTYQDGEGIISGNWPGMTLDGNPVVWGSAEPMVEEEEDNE